MRGELTAKNRAVVECRFPDWFSDPVIEPRAEDRAILAVIDHDSHAAVDLLATRLRAMNTER